MKNRHSTFAAAATFLALAGTLYPAETAPKSAAGGKRLAHLTVLSGGYPRVVFFRVAERGPLPGHTYEQWDAEFSRLMGMVGKSSGEELRHLPNRCPAELYTRFKEAHPDQLLLLHFNGNGRDPTYENHRFFAGHWLYFNGCRVTGAIPAEAGETTLQVENPALFATGFGHYKNCNDDIGLCRLDERGRPDWSESEQVRLLAIDPAAGTITVRRGCFGTVPKAFAAGKAYAAAHCNEVPWGDAGNLLWVYNFSTTCPRDAQGRVCSDILADQLAELLSESGPRAAFDGIEFDSAVGECGDPRKTLERMEDADADGRGDAGFFDGINQYGVGVVDFYRKLRARLGDDRLILADGTSEDYQRGFGILNGVESEGWPKHTDPKINDWSGGLNRMNFWASRGRAPALSYTAHKFSGKLSKQGDTVKLDNLPLSTHRLVSAAMMFTGSMIAESWLPKSENGMRGIWDEYRMGKENRLGWLGQPVAPAVRLAQREGKPVDLLPLIAGDNTNVALEGKVLKVAPTPNRADPIRLQIRNIPVKGKDFFIAMKLRGSVGEEPARRMKLNGMMAYFDEAESTAGFYFENVRAKSLDIEVELEGGKPLWIEAAVGYSHPDVIYREFEKGLVLANPSPRPYTFDLSRLFPGAQFRRLKGTKQQDPVTNDGSPVGDSITLPPKDGLFLVRGVADGQ